MGHYEVEHFEKASSPVYWQASSESKTEQRSTYEVCSFFSGATSRVDRAVLLTLNMLSTV